MVAGRPGASRVGSLLGALTLAAATLVGCGADKGDQVMLYHAPAPYLRALIDRCNEEAAGRYRIVARTLPRAADGQHEQLVRRLAAGDTDPDILALDVTWVPEFAEAGWLQEWTGTDKAEAVRGVLETPLATATWEGRIYAATANTNVQLLWYDKTLTPAPPRTWHEMLAMAGRLKAAGRQYRILFTGAQYEGLVVQYNSIVASAGGRILSGDGRSVVMDEGAVRGLELLREVSASGLTSPSLRSDQEPQVYRAFAARDSEAAFQLNWADALAATRELNPARAANLAATTYPAVHAGDKGRATIGGLNLGVSAYSQGKRQAFDAVLCLRDTRSQRFAAICGGAPPTIEAIYADESSIGPCEAGAVAAGWDPVEDSEPVREVAAEHGVGEPTLPGEVDGQIRAHEQGLRPCAAQLFQCGPGGAVRWRESRRRVSWARAYNQWLRRNFRYSTKQITRITSHTPG